MNRSYYTTCFLMLMMISGIAHAKSEYPKTRDELRSEEIGSVLGGEGIVFRPTKIKNTSTQTIDSKINGYLWQATLDVVDFAPIISSDSNNGIIVTDWYSNSKEPNRSLKLKVYIKGDVISPESLETELKQRVLKNGRWLEDNAPSTLGATMEDKILRRARQLYLRKSNKN